MSIYQKFIFNFALQIDFQDSNYCNQKRSHKLKKKIILVHHLIFSRLENSVSRKLKPLLFKYGIELVTLQVILGF